MPPSITVPGNLVPVERGGKTHGASAAALAPQVPLQYIMDYVRARLGRVPGSLGDRVLVLRSSTGSGKSTMIPPELYHAFYDMVDRRGIVCTQPRALTAADIPNQIVPYHTAEALRAAGTPGRTPLELGVNLGYQTGPNTLRASRGINFVTTQVLVRQLVTLTDAEFRAKYAFVIVDEAHERSLPLDMLLWGMRRFLQRNIGHRDCPMLIVMSATFDPFGMADYLLAGIASRYAHIIQVRGAVYDKADTYLATDCTDIIGAVRERLVAIVSSGESDLAPLNPFRDVLVFVPDGGVGRDVAAAVEALNGGHAAFAAAPVRYVYLDSKAVASRNEDYRAIYTPYDELRTVVGGKPVSAVRRVIAATNVAETGLTLDNLRYVIDTGLYLCNEFNPIVAADVLHTKVVTAGMRDQRYGRVGRKAPGFGYMLYTKATAAAMQADAYPSVVTADVTMDLLTIMCELCDPEGATKVNLRKALGSTDFWLAARATRIDLLGLDMLTVPPVDMIQYALDRMLVLGAIDCNCTPTALGFVFNALDKITLESAAMIMSAYAWRAQPQELVTIAALLERGCAALSDWSAESAAVRAVTGGDTFIDLLLTYEEYMASYGNVARHETRSKTGGACGCPGLEGGDEVPLDYDSTLGSAHGGGASRAPPDREAVFRQLARENEYRDNYMACLAKIGYNPFANFSAGIRTPRLDTESTIAYVRRLKMCIYEGYKTNLAEWNGYAYIVLRSGVQIATEHRGRFVVFGPILLMRGEYTATHICPLDGYVNVDKNFTLR